MALLFLTMPVAGLTVLALGAGSELLFLTLPGNAGNDWMSFSTLHTEVFVETILTMRVPREKQ